MMVGLCHYIYCIIYEGQVGDDSPVVGISTMGLCHYIYIYDIWRLTITLPWSLMAFNGTQENGTIWNIV